MLIPDSSMGEATFGCVFFRPPPLDPPCPSQSKIVERDILHSYKKLMQLLTIKADFCNLH